MKVICTQKDTSETRRAPIYAVFFKGETVAVHFENCGKEIYDAYQPGTAYTLTLTPEPEQGE